MKSALFALLLTVLTAACTQSSGSSSPIVSPGNNQQPSEPSPPSPPTLQTVPEADPATVKGIPSLAWATVQYAFCSAQGRFGVLIDFRGTPMEKQAGGHYKLAIRSCDGSGDYHWADEHDFTVQMQDGKKMLNFGSNFQGNDSEDTIDIGDQPGSDSNYSVFAGNSGPCVFLDNKGTKGVFDNDPVFGCK